MRSANGSCWRQTRGVVRAARVLWGAHACSKELCRPRQRDGGQPMRVVKPAEAGQLSRPAAAQPSRGHSSGRALFSELGPRLTASAASGPGSGA